MKLVTLAVLAVAIGSRAELSYYGGATMKGPIPSCSCGQNYNPGPLYNQLDAPYPDKYAESQTFQEVPSNVQTDSSQSRCSCGCLPDTVSLVAGEPEIIGPRVIHGAPQLYGFVNPPEFRQPTPPPTPVNPGPPLPKGPESRTNNETPSHIMKIPKKSDSSITITLNSPDSPSSSFPTYNSIQPFSPPAISPPPFAFPRNFFYTQQPQLVASCPATVPFFYPTSIPTFSVYPPVPPFTCPVHPPSPDYSSPPPYPNQQFQTTFSPTPTTTTPSPPRPKDDGKTIASFTSTIPETKFYNVTTSPEKRDPLLTFKLLSAAASKSQELSSSTTTSPEADAANKDCSMPIPPVVVS